MSPRNPSTEAARAGDIFDAALARKGDDREIYLLSACGDNVALRQRVEALLRAHAAAGGFLPEIPTPTAPGWIVSGRVIGDYELTEEIGRGGMGVVYRARQRSLGRVVALKVLPLAQFSSPGAMKRFRAEAAMAAALQHPNIVAIHEVGEHEGQPYYSMDYIQGQDLAELVRDKPLSARRAASLLKSIAEAVEHAHGRGILHRDLKPSNVLVDLLGQPRITDFGLATRVGDPVHPDTESIPPPDDRSDLDSRIRVPSFAQTLSGAILGSPNYMPPEQASGQGVVSSASDVYSLGAILFHLLTGRPPFQAETIEDTVLQLLRVEPPAPRLLNRSIPRDLETICLKCLSKAPACRYPTAQALADDLDRFLKGEPIRARQAGLAQRLVKWCRRHPARAAAVVGLAAVAIASALTAMHLQSLSRELRLHLYVQDMNVALRSWQEGNTAQTFDLLKRHLPSGDGADLRAFEWAYLWKLCRGNYSQWLPRHKQVVGTLRFSPDGRLLATFSWDGTLRIWQRDPRSNLGTFSNVAGLGGFTRDGRSVLVGRNDHSLQLLDAHSGTTNRTLSMPGDLAAFAPDAQLLALITPDDFLKVFHLSEAEPRVTVPGIPRRKLDYGWDYPVSISGHGRWLAVIRSSVNPLRPELAIRLWDLETGSELPPFSENRQIRCMQFSPDGSVLAVGCGDGTITLWNVVSRKATRIHSHDGPVLSLAFSPDGHWIATGSSDRQKLRLWNVRDGESVRKTFTGQVGDVWSLAFAPEGGLLASGSRDSPIRLWTMNADAAGETVSERLHADEYGNFCFSPDGRWMAGGCADNTVKVWEVATLNVRGVLRNTTYVAVFSKDSREVLASTKDGVPQWWNFKDQTTRAIPGYSGQLSHVISMDLSADRRTAALGMASGEIQILDIESGKPVGQPLRAHQGHVRSVAFSPAGDKLASGGSDKAVMVWDVRSQRGLGVCAEHKGAVFGVAISPNGRTLASGCGSETIKLWNVANVSTGSVASISYHSSVVRTLAFSPDGRTLASGSEDNTVKLWNLATRREAASFKYESHVRLVVFSPDGNALAVITDSGTLRILRAASLDEVWRDWRDFLR